MDLGVKEPATAQPSHREGIRSPAKTRDQEFLGIFLSVGVVIFLGGFYGMFIGLGFMVK